MYINIYTYKYKCAYIYTHITCSQGMNVTVIVAHVKDKALRHFCSMNYYHGSSSSSSSWSSSSSSSSFFLFFSSSSSSVSSACFYFNLILSMICLGFSIMFPIIIIFVFVATLSSSHDLITISKNFPRCSQDLNWNPFNGSRRLSWIGSF